MFVASRPPLPAPRAPTICPYNPGRVVHHRNLRRQQLRPGAKGLSGPTIDVVGVFRGGDDSKQTKAAMRLLRPLSGSWKTLSSRQKPSKSRRGGGSNEDCNCTMAALDLTGHTISLLVFQATPGRSRLPLLGQLTVTPTTSPDNPEHKVRTPDVPTWRLGTPPLAADPSGLGQRRIRIKCRRQRPRQHRLHQLGPVRS